METRILVFGLVLIGVYIAETESKQIGDDELIHNVTAQGVYGEEAMLTCIFKKTDKMNVHWTFDGHDYSMADATTTTTEAAVSANGTTTAKPPSRHTTIVTDNQFILKIASPTEVDAINYTCSVEEQRWPIYLNLSFPGKLVTMEPSEDIMFRLISGTHENTMREEDRTLNLTCIFEVYNEADVEWIVQLKGVNKTLKGTTTRNKKQLISTYTTKMRLKLFDEQNGKYVCRVKDPHTGEILSGEKDVKIIVAPSIAINFAKPVSSSEIFFNWTVKNFNSEITGYELVYRHSTSPNFQFLLETINITTNYYVLSHLSSNTTYIIRLRVKTFTDSEAVEFSNTTLAEDPDFVPEISINELTARSMSLGISVPPPNVAEHVNFYQLQMWKKNTENIREAIHYRDGRNLPYMFKDLNPNTTYVFRAKACFEFGDTFKFQRCGDWSTEMDAITMDDALTEDPDFVPNIAINEFTSRSITIGISVPPPNVAKHMNFYLLQMWKQNNQAETIKQAILYRDDRNLPYIFNELNPNTTYVFRAKACFSSRDTFKFLPCGNWSSEMEAITMDDALAEDPDFVPNIAINEFTARSITIGMSVPPPNVAEHMNFYLLQMWKKNQTETIKEAILYGDNRNLPYIFNELNPNTTYVFRAKACFGLGDTFKFQRCGNWSTEMEAITMDEICNLPKKVGPCQAAFRKWYYDNTLKQCRQFIYGGCRGNMNRFNSESECLSHCNL